jgi:hypothetical protein
VGGILVLDEYSEEFMSDADISAARQQNYYPNPQAYQGIGETYYQQQPVYQAPPPPPPPPPRQPQYQQPARAYAQPVMQPPIYQEYAASPQQEGRSRINHIFNEESKELNELLRAEESGGCLKNIVFVLLAIGVIVVSFWGSFTLGSKLFLPNKQTQKQKDIIPGFSLSGVKSTLKDTFTSGAQVVKPQEEFKRYVIPDQPTTPIIPPEIRAQEPVRKTVVQPTAVVPKVTSYTGTGSTSSLYRVIAGAYNTKQEAQDSMRLIQADGFPVFMYHADGKYRLQIGDFKNKAGATETMKKAAEYGYNAFISTK